jgi:hypothetical protein
MKDVEGDWDQPFINHANKDESFDR